ncbi:MAG: ribosomal-processing cysteine protease Prp [Lachnospiraceae bacterium]|nr:ribosomal-processing cysteine protease Prp [Lachnospiraceae bacterium]MCR5766939.1 ribosomal-processing cysteine protease Prp [Lachnospiraceae bacterium]
MIRVSFRYDDNNDPIAFRCEGHAGYDRSGRDIVCSAVSILTINTVNSVESFTEDRFTLETDEKRGYMYFSLNDEPSDDSRLLLKSLELGIKGIVEEYGNRFIKLVEWEV